MKVNTLLARTRRLGDPQFAVAACVALVVEIGLTISTVPRLAGLLGIRLASDEQSKAMESVSGPPPTVWIQRRVAAVQRVLRRWPFGDTCLRRALVLGHRVRRLDPVLVIGVRHDDNGQFAAHAWLTVDGVAWDPLASQYSPLHDLSKG